MGEDLILKDEWQPLQQGRDEDFPDPLEVKEEEVLKFSSEMIDESREDYTEEQRQNLHHKISAMSTPEKFRLAIFANREVRGMLIRSGHSGVLRHFLSGIWHRTTRFSPMADY